jgi:deoxyhypusine synthase
MNVTDFMPTGTIATSTPLTLVDAADAYAAHLDSGGQHARDAGRRDVHGGAWSISLAEMIRQRAGSTPSAAPAANLEEDVFNLVAHDHYVRIPELAFDLTPAAGEAARAPTV